MQKQFLITFLPSEAPVMNRCLITFNRTNQKQTYQELLNDDEPHREYAYSDKHKCQVNEIQVKAKRMSDAKDSET